MATINVSNSTFAGLANKANTKGTKTVAPTKGAQVVTLEYLYCGINSKNKDLAFARQLGEAILNGLEAVEGRPAFLNGQEVTAVELAAYEALPAAVKTAIKYEPAVEGAPKVSGMRLLASLAVTLCPEIVEILTNYNGALLTKNERDGQIAYIETAKLNEAETAKETDELDGFLQ